FAAPRGPSRRTFWLTWPSSARCSTEEKRGRMIQPMLRSADRILTTHTSSLPRPPELTRLYVRRARGEAVDPAALAAAGKAALAWVVPKQMEAGIDVGNNGEQQRESFFLYLRDRLTGLGGSWERTSRADVDRYPAFRQMWNEQHAAKTQISSFS